MKSKVITIIGCLAALCAVAAGLIQSGWTTTSDPAAARVALGVTAFGVDFGSIIVTNGITNLNLAASTLVKADANQALSSVDNASGALTNNGAGVFGFYPNFASIDAANHFTAANVFSGGTTVSGGITAPGVGFASENFGHNSTVNGADGTALGDSAACIGLGSTAFGGNAEALATESTSIGYASQAIAPFSTAIGAEATTSQAHQIVLGTATEWVSAPNTLSVNGGLTNGSLTANTVVATDLHKKLVSIANGSGALNNDGSGNLSWATAGTVSSVGLTVPAALLSVAGSPITSSGSFTITLPTQSPNTIFAGPGSGGSATPTFRSLVDRDLLGRAIPSVVATGVADGWILGASNELSGWTQNGAALTNLTYRYTTSAIPALTISFASKAYFTNIAANITLAIAAPDVASFETCVLFITNSSATDWKVTFPNGVWGTPGSGTPPSYYCTNKMLTRINVEHFGQQMTNAFKLDFAP